MTKNTAQNVKSPTVRIILMSIVNRKLIVVCLDGKHVIKSYAWSIVIRLIGAKVTHKMNVKKDLKMVRQKS